MALRGELMLLFTVLVQLACVICESNENLDQRNNIANDNNFVDYLQELYLKSLVAKDNPTSYGGIDDMSATDVDQRFSSSQDANDDIHDDKRFSEFLGGKRSAEKRFSEFLGGKKRFSEFLGGKRKRFSEFLGGKKRFSEFLGGKRKRYSEFPGGKRSADFSEFLGGKRSGVASLVDQEPEKRFSEFLGGR